MIQDEGHERILLDMGNERIPLDKRSIRHDAIIQDIEFYIYCNIHLCEEENRNSI